MMMLREREQANDSTENAKSRLTDKMYDLERIHESFLPRTGGKESSAQRRLKAEPHRLAGSPAHYCHYGWVIRQVKCRKMAAVTARISGHGFAN
jgi:hypothetical protein